MVYVVREALRQTDLGFHLVAGSGVAKFVDVLMVQESGEQEGLLHEPRSTAFRRQDNLALYLPPLPQSVIQKLGVLCTDSRARRASVHVSAGLASPRRRTLSPEP